MKATLLLSLFMCLLLVSKAQWETDVKLTSSYSSMTAISNNGHAIATSGDSIHIVWYDYRDGNSEIYYKRSIDGGITWGEDVRLTNNKNESQMPSIGVSGSVVHVSWCDQRDLDWEIYYKRSTDGGNSWGTDTRISYIPGNSWHPSLTVVGKSVHLVWYEELGGLWDIMYTRSIDGGISWEEDIWLTDDPSGSFRASICALGQVIHVAWYDTRDGNPEIYYRRSVDNGLNWEAETRLTDNSKHSMMPCIGVSDSGVYVVWIDDRESPFAIYYKISTDGGLTWGEDTRLTFSSYESLMPNLAVSGTGLFIVWVDNSEGFLKVYYKSSADGGLNWGPDTKLTDGLYDSERAFISISGSQVNVVWSDTRDGYYAIYYKRNPAATVPFGTEEKIKSKSDNRIHISPNPSSTSILVRFNFESNDNTYLSIRNILGEEVLFRQIQNNEEIFDISGLTNGIYFTCLVSDKTMLSLEKLLISK